MSARTHRVVIAGGGVAGLEALLALRVLAGHRLEVILLTPEAQVDERPPSVGQPFGRGGRRLTLRAIAADQGAELRLEALRAVDVDQRLVELSSGALMGYDSLVVAVGATPTEALSGAVTFGGPGDVPAVRAAVDDLAAGRAGSLALVVPTPSSWPLPAYELALMAGTELRNRGFDGPITLVTPEAAPLELFGAPAAAALGPMLDQRRIAVRTGARVVALDAGRLALAGGASVPGERVIALSRPSARSLPGLPVGTDGFLPVNEHGAVSYAPDVYAAGDVTAFPLKQGGIAAQQADAAAEAIAARLGAVMAPQPFEPVVRGLLLTGGEPLYLRARGRDGVAVRAGAPLRTEGGTASWPALWWPPAKVAARYLAPYLATARPHPLGAHPLEDRPGPRGRLRRTEQARTEHGEACALALLTADGDARSGDYAGALRALQAAEALDGALPEEYEGKRRQWTAAVAAGHRLPPPFS